jgi:Nif-specific regulatory protein
LPQLNAAVIQPVSPAGTLSSSSRPYSWVREDEEQSLLEALQQTGGNKTRAAALLGMTARQFRYRLEKLALTDSH